MWSDYNSRRRTRRLVARLGWMAVGGLLVLISLPYFPTAWAAFIGDTQDTITEKVNWGEDPQRSVVIPSDGSVQIKVDDPAKARRGDLVQVGGREYEVISRWSGSESDEINFSAGVTPWLLVWDAEQRSSLSAEFKLGYVVSGNIALADAAKAAGEFLSSVLLYTDEDYSSEEAEGSFIITDAGRGRIIIDSSGVDWSAMAVREP